MPTIRKTPLLLTAALGALALAGSAAGTTSTAAQTRHFQAPIEALSISGGNLAFDLGRSYTNRQGKVANKANKVLVWNARTGKTTKVSGKKTASADNTSTGARVFELAIAGTKVAWIANEGGNTQGYDELYTSSVKSPKEREVAHVARVGEGCGGRETACAGDWLGGLVNSESVILYNTWKTDGQGNVTRGELSKLVGASPKLLSQSAGTVEAASSDRLGVAVLRPSGTVALYARAGELLQTIHPAAPAKEVALSLDNLVVLEQNGALAVYDTRTGSLRKTFQLKGNPSYLEALDVQGNVAVYSEAVRFKTNAVSVGAIHAINLTTGKDRAIGTLGGEINLAKLDSTGLAYASNGYGAYRYGNGTLVFVPFAKVAAAVS